MAEHIHVPPAHLVAAVFSAAAVTDSTACVPVWSGPSPYSAISAPVASLMQSASLNDTSDSCQASCGAAIDCQFYVFRESQADPADNGCWLKLTSLAPSQNTYVAYKLLTGYYTVYPADQGNSTALASICCRRRGWVLSSGGRGSQLYTEAPATILHKLLIWQLV